MARLERAASERFAAKCAAMDSACVVWKGYLDPDGYGRFRSEIGMELAHRYANRMAFGPIPQGIDVHHICRNRACVNTTHHERIPATLHRRQAARLERQNRKAIGG